MLSAYSALLLTLFCAVFCSATYIVLRRIKLCYLHCSAQYSALLHTLFYAVVCSATYTALRSILLCYIHTLFYAVFCSATYTALHSILLCYIHCYAQYSALLHTLFCAVFSSATYTFFRDVLWRGESVSLTIAVASKGHIVQPWVMDEWSSGGLIGDRRKSQYSETKLSQCHFVHHRGDIDQQIFDFIGHWGELNKRKAMGMLYIFLHASPTELPSGLLWNIELWVCT